MAYVFRRPWFPRRRKAALIPQLLKVTVGGIAATAVAASLVPNIIPAVSGINATGAVAAVSISESVPPTGTNATGAATGVFGQDSTALSGASSSGAVQSLAIAELDNLSGIFGSGAVTVFAIRESVAVGGVFGTGAAQGPLGILEPGIQFPGATSVGAVAGLTVTVGAPIVGVNASAALQPLPATEPFPLVGVFGTGVVGTILAQSATLVNLTGISATGAVQAITSPVFPAITAVFGTGTAPAITPSVQVPTLAGVNSFGQVGSSLSIVEQITPSGIFGTGSVNAIANPPEIFVTINGAFGTGASNGIFVAVDLIGISATAAASDFAHNQPISGINALGASQSVIVENDENLAFATAFGVVAATQFNNLVGLVGVNSSGSAQGFAIIELEQLGVFATAVEASLVLPDSTSLGNVFATGSVLAGFEEVDATITGALATAIASVQFGPNGFFNGVAAFSVIGNTIAQTSQIMPGAFAFGINGLVIGEADESLVSGIATGVVSLQSLAEQVTLTSGAAASAVAIPISTISAPNISGIAGTGVANVQIQTLDNFQPAPSFAIAQPLTDVDTIATPAASPPGIGAANPIAVILVATGSVSGANSFGAAGFINDGDTVLLNGINSISANGTVIAMVSELDHPTTSAFGIGQAQNVVQPGTTQLVGANATAVVAGNLQLGKLPPFTGVNASAAVGQIAVAAYLIGVTAIGVSQPIPTIDLSDSPLLSGTFANAAVGTFSILPTLTGIQVNTVAAALSPNRTLASAVAQAASGALPFLYTVMVGTTAIGGANVTTIFLVSFDINNAITIHGMASKNLPPA